MSTAATQTEVKERPIIFSAESVRAILSGSKTQTRRVIKDGPKGNFWSSPHWSGYPGDLWYVVANLNPPSMHMFKACPYGKVGDRLWVRETHIFLADGFGLTPSVKYRADGVVVELKSLVDGTTVYNAEKPSAWKWKPSIYMRREHSRITLEITEVRVQRLQDISEEDAIAEGLQRSERTGLYPSPAGNCDYAAWAYCYLWDSINAKRGYSWESNPFVWCVSFRRI